jgi:hypothetical protein
MCRILLGIVLFLSCQAFCTTGNELLQSCKESVRAGQSNAAVQSSACSGYIDGAIDAYSMVRSGLGYDTKYPEGNICVPADLTPGQKIHLLIKFMEHPEQLHLDGSELVIDAFLKAFPCHK